MNQSIAKSALVSGVFGVLVAAAVFLADIAEKQWSPLPFTPFHTSLEDVATLMLLFGGATFVFVFLGRLLFSSKQRAPHEQFAFDFFNFLLAYTVVLLYQFLASSMTFNPNLMIYVGLISAGLICAYFAVLGGPRPGSSLVGRIGSMVAGLFRRAITLHGIVVLLLFMTPMGLAVGFMMDRNIADTITAIRLQLNKERSADWTFHPLWTEVKFRRPMEMRFAPSNDSEIFVLERAGKLFRLDYPSGSNKTLVLDFSDRVGTVAVENGALGFDLHPTFHQRGAPGSGKVYVYYTDVRDDRQINRVSRFDLTADNALASEQVLMNLNRNTDAYHNGGSVDFGPDGYLYIAVGEGVKTKQHRDLATTLRSGILRIDVDQDGGSLPIRQQPANGETAHYAIPSDNPFVGNERIMDEFWSIGFRNPFRMSFDSETGDIWTGDVGSAVWEEVNKVVRGGNHLYPFHEGPAKLMEQQPENAVGKITHPMYSYRHNAFDRAVIGGVVVRGSRYPALRGRYIFGDNFSGKVYSIGIDGPTEEAILLGQAEQYAQRGISSIRTASDGQILVSLLGSNQVDTGEIVVLASSDGSERAAPPATVAQEDLPYDEASTLAVFQENCGRCHGSEGGGDGPDSELFDIEMADFATAEFQGKYNDEEIAAIIGDGGQAQGLSPLMPPWGAVLSDGEIRNLVQLIRSFGEDER